MIPQGIQDTSIVFESSPEVHSSIRVSSTMHMSTRLHLHDGVRDDGDAKGDQRADRSGRRGAAPLQPVPHQRLPPRQRVRYLVCCVGCQAWGAE